MIDLAVASHAHAASLCVVLGPPERRDAIATSLPEGVAAVADDRPGFGPMGGLATALARHREAWVAVQAVDVPLLPASWWGRLAARHVAGTVAVVPRGDDGRWEPLAALYHGCLATEVDGLLRDGARIRTSFQPWLDTALDEGRITAVPVSALPAGALRNVNRPEDADAVAATLREARSSGA